MKKKSKTEKVTLATIAKTLEGVATKVDLTKTLQGVATKVDLDKAIENLAIITNNGFANTVSKEDFSEFKEEMTEFKEEMTEFKHKTGLTLFNIDSKLQTVDQRLDAIEKTLGPLVHVSDAVQRELREHNERIARIEHKIGLVAK